MSLWNTKGPLGLPLWIWGVAGLFIWKKGIKIGGVEETKVILTPPPAKPPGDGASNTN